MLDFERQFPRGLHDTQEKKMLVVANKITGTTRFRAWHGLLKKAFKLHDGRRQLGIKRRLDAVVHLENRLNSQCTPTLERVAMVVT
jgi:hypothetical protein